MASCTVNLNRNTTVYVKDFADGIRFTDVVADNVPNASDVNYPGWYMENVTGMFMDNVDAAGGLAKVRPSFFVSAAHRKIRKLT